MPNATSKRGTTDPQSAVTPARTCALIGSLALGLLLAGAAPLQAQTPPACVPTHTIAQVQGNGATTPWADSSVALGGVVTARLPGPSLNGFFLQMPVGDGDASTSDGIFVSTGSEPAPLEAMPGNEVCVEGQVTELVNWDDVNAPTVTGLLAGRVVLVNTGRPLPAPVTLDRRRHAGRQRHRRPRALRRHARPRRVARRRRADDRRSRRLPRCRWRAWRGRSASPVWTSTMAGRSTPRTPSRSSTPTSSGCASTARRWA